MHAIQVDLAYPSIDGIRPDPVAARQIAPAYASAKSELAAILQYLFHHFHFDKDEMTEYSDLMEGIAVCEMHHFDILGSLLLRLGADPIFTACPPFACNFFTSSCVSRSTTPSKMLMDNITSETEAIAMYENMLSKLCNESVAAVISRIILDEKLHLIRLNEALAKLSDTPKAMKPCGIAPISKPFVSPRRDTCMSPEMTAESASTACAEPTQE